MIWKEKYKIGVPLIDTQHEELFRRVTNFVETLRMPGEWEAKIPKVEETLLFMKDYVIVHFHDEEVYQKEIGYPQLQEHCKIHRDMVKYVAEVAAACEKEGFRQDRMQQFGGKLLAWLINHVVATDHKIAEYAGSREEVR